MNNVDSTKSVLFEIYPSCDIVAIHQIDGLFGRHYVWKRLKISFNSRDDTFLGVSQLIWDGEGGY